MNRLLSNAIDVKPQPTRAWTMLIQVVENAHVQQSRSGSNFKRLVLSDRHSDVRGIVLRCLPSNDYGSEMTTRRDVVIVNEKKMLMLLTLWNQFNENEGTTLANMVQQGPMIFGMRLKVTTFNCLSLTTRGTPGLR